MRGIQKIIIVGSAIILSGCATLSKEECMQADWHKIGYHDGAAGRPISRLTSHNEACSEVNITPDTNAYNTGRNKGLKRYCTAENGMQQGLKGKTYYKVCPANLEAGFLPRYRLGRDVRNARNDLKRINRNITEERKELRQENKRADKREERREIRALKAKRKLIINNLAQLNICISPDSYEAGLHYAGNGFPNKTGLIRTCHNYGVQVDRKQFFSGFRQGNARYCTYNSGLNVGQHNQEYLGACTGQAHNFFWSGYQAGREIARYEQEVREIEHDIRHQEQALKKKEITDAKRRSIRHKLKQLDHEHQVVTAHLRRIRQ